MDYWYLKDCPWHLKDRPGTTLFHVFNMSDEVEMNMDPFEDIYDEWAAEMDAETEREAKAESDARLAELLAEWDTLTEEQWAKAEAEGDEDTLIHLREIKAIRAQWEAEIAEAEAAEAEAEQEEEEEVVIVKEDVKKK
jgi:hypothetical protein